MRNERDFSFANPADGQGIGARLPRKEDDRLMRGRGQFVADIRLAGLKDVAFLRSPVAHARIKAIRVPERYSNVVFTEADLADVKPIRAVTSLADNTAHRPRLLSDNGASYVAGDLADWLEDKGMQHVRGAPYHPQTQGMIERWHQTLKNRILLNNYYLPGDLEQQTGVFVEHYNHIRYHESIENLTPADVYFGRAEPILAERRRIKLATNANRRLQHRLQAAQTLTPDEPEPPFSKCLISLKLSDDEQTGSRGERADLAAFDPDQTWTL